MAASGRKPMDVAQEMIRATEEVTIAIDAKSSIRDDVDSDTWADHEPPVQRRKIIAVVTHPHPNGLHVQGCVFIITQKPPRMESIPDEYVVEHAYLIVPGFSISMSQPRRSTIDLTPSMSAFSQAKTVHPKSEMTVTISPGEDTPYPSIKLQTNDTQGLRQVLDECKRLKETSAHLSLGAHSGDAFDFEPFSWVMPYVARHTIPPLLTSIPPDIRLSKQPLYTRLPAASAGISGNDIADIELIREDWMRRRAHDEVLWCSEETAGLKIRIGTFNVNGTLPSQDLSAWVGGQVARPTPTIIPPLKEVSPLNMEEIIRSPLEALPKPVVQEAGADAEVLSLSTPSDTMTFINIDLDAESSETAETLVRTPTKKVPEDPADPDMLVLGFQELDLSTEALLYSTSTAREDAWCTAVFAGLGEKAILYEKLTSRRLVGMLLVVIVKRRLSPNFSDVRTASVGAGIMGIMGNKGAVGARLLFTPYPSATAEPGSESKPVAVTFVNAHLAAFDEMFDKRNADFHDLSRRLYFDSATAAATMDEGPATGSWYTPEPGPLTIFETDALFWLVNLNYRLNLPDADVRSLLADEQLRDENMSMLRRFDQLALAKRTSKAFDEFDESPISHLPSYRFSPGILSDSLGYDTKRKPAWTDRVLYMSSPAVRMKQTSYESHPTITFSDHRPVSAEFELEVPLVSVPAYESFVQRIWRDVSGIEYAEYRPRIRLSSTNVDFSKIAYKRAVTRTLEVQNVGEVSCIFRFVGQSPNAPACPSWLRVDAMTGLVLPGETVQITLTADVDAALASQLNVGQTRLEDTLVLHTAHGREHFIAISGDYERTCFATSMAWLVRLPGSVRSLASPSDVLPEERSVNAPREIMRLVNWLMSHATETPGLFVSRGNPEVVRQIRESLDTGEEFSVGGTEGDPATARAFADALLQLLDSLTEPVIPASLHARCAQMAGRDEAFEVLDQLPMVNVNVWISLTAFLHFIGQQDGAPGYGEQLVAAFAPVLFRDDLTSATPVSVIGGRNFLRYFIG
ncbi:DNase I-like protein [Epithele typhae]|uniref:DNase I-like protein n=1 Tax=Epithele typhae TaxID=378194 RepID=UPI0020077D5D|nr:DNase I-like protein [Epithele typhae]KAH9925009.1 DNase I-like protein [Epithele typhae]